MSAFFVSKATIDAAVTLITSSGNAPWDQDARTNFGQELWLLNASAVCQRYRDERLEDYTAEISAYTYAARAEGAPALLKALDCLVYQCAEGDVCRQAIFKGLTELTEALASLRKTDAYKMAVGDIDA